MKQIDREMIKKGTYFVTGIDTNIGKSIATGWLANRWLAKGVNLMTQKMIQTGNEAISEDIELHRALMKLPLTPEDVAGVTCPIVLTYPASPHLAAQIDGVTIDPQRITAATQQLEAKYDVVLLEGAGGLAVPLTPTLLTIDYVAQQHYPIILVTSGRLGSINHTILSLEAIQQRGLELHTVIYNNYPLCDEVIAADTQSYLANYLAHHSPQAELLVMDEVKW